MIVSKGPGIRYKTEFFQCSGCTVMFRDPVKFTKFEPYRAPEPTPLEQRKKEQKLAYFAGRKSER